MAVHSVWTVVVSSGLRTGQCIDRTLSSQEILLDTAGLMGAGMRGQVRDVGMDGWKTGAVPLRVNLLVSG